MNRSVVLSLIVLVGILVGGVASAQTFSTSVLEQFFRFEWDVVPSRGGPVMKGYVYNSSGYRAINVRLLAIELDAAGQAVKQTATWVPPDIPPKGRTYFEVPVARADAKYLVTLESFGLEQENTR